MLLQYWLTLFGTPLLMALCIAIGFFVSRFLDSLEPVRHLEKLILIFRGFTRSERQPQFQRRFASSQFVSKSTNFGVSLEPRLFSAFKWPFSTDSPSRREISLFWGLVSWFLLLQTSPLEVRAEFSSRINHDIDLKCTNSLFERLEIDSVLVRSFKSVSKNSFGFHRSNSLGCQSPYHAAITLRIVPWHAEL